MVLLRHPREFREGDYEEIMNKASCLNLISECGPGVEYDSKEAVSYYTKEFSLIYRVISRISKSLNFSYTSRRGLAKGLKRRGGLGFLPGGPPTAEEDFLRTLDLRGKTVFDVGGFIGLMTIFFASRAAHVVTYEPLPASRSKIRRSEEHTSELQSL